MGIKVFKSGQQAFQFIGDNYSFPPLEMGGEYYGIVVDVEGQRNDYFRYLITIVEKRSFFRRIKSNVFVIASVDGALQKSIDLVDGDLVLWKCFIPNEDPVSGRIIKKFKNECDTLTGKFSVDQ